MTISLEKTNPEIDQDRVEDTVDHFNKFGYIMFPQQRGIYQRLSIEIPYVSCVLDVGCGNGVGTNELCIESRIIYPCDKLQRNVNFAQCLYPQFDFFIWDMQEEFTAKLSVDVTDVVCVEAIEHVACPQKAIKNFLSIAKNRIWISTPNGKGKERPPSNPYHVQEYTTEEMLEMILECTGFPESRTQILHWETFEELSVDTNVDPLVYKITKG